MTPLKAIENIHDVKAVPSTRYPRNEICGHPECDKPTESVHHIFGRPPGEHSDSWFVTIPVNGQHPSTNPKTLAKRAIPHAIGLCGHGTAGHHGDVEAHESWIRYEDGVYVWYDRVPENDRGEYPREHWERVGLLDPQPFGWGDKKRKTRKRKQGMERRTSRNASYRLPEEMYGTKEVKGMLDDALEVFEEIWAAAIPGSKKRSAGATLVDAVMCGVLWVQTEGPRTDGEA